MEELKTVDFDAEPDDAPKKVHKKPGGTFASMGLSRLVLKAVERKGYRLATPIQRKCIPPIMEGRDVVAMARTGSGKSAAFLLPLIDKLKIRQPKSAIRALVLSPTRELAMQSFKFVREFSKFTNLIPKLIIGGESISKDFETITSSPDILIATPGRLAHVLVEMKFKFKDLEIVVFDEADRLFEPGFKEIEQVNEICQRLPDSRQTLLFSATMPQKLADFAKVGLKNPLFIRLDVETNLSETLKTIHLHCNQQDKFAALVYLLKNFVDKEQMTVVFMPTKHHIEYTTNLLSKFNLECCYVYSSMDPEARKINIDRFTKKHCRIMLVTDIAARGIDIPLLDVVINYNFPSKPKLFIHRVGRVARAGRFGCAISLIAHDETPFLHALHIFFGLPLTLASELKSAEFQDITMETLPDKVLGAAPQQVLDLENEVIRDLHSHDEELKSMTKVCENAMKPYLKTRELTAHFSVKAAKDIHKKVIGVHPMFRIMDKSSSPSEGEECNQAGDDNETDFLSRIRSYKPQATIFEVGHIKGNRRTEAFEVMQKKRQFHDKVVQNNSTKESDSDSHADDDQEERPEPELKKGFEDSKFYLKYQPDDYAKEKGLAIDKTSFDRDLKRATLDLVADDENQLKRQRHQMVWDRKHKKYIRADQMMNDDKRTKKLKTESGAYISASYQSGLFEKWKSQSKYDQKLQNDDADSDGDSNSGINNSKSSAGHTGGARRRGKSITHGAKGEGRISLEKLHDQLKPAKRRWNLKNTEEIFKERSIQEKREAILKRKIAHKKGRAEANKETPSKGFKSKKAPRKGRSGSNKGEANKGGGLGKAVPRKGGGPAKGGSMRRGGGSSGGRGGGGGARGGGGASKKGNFTRPGRSRRSASSST